ncbi:MAG TPA: phage major capsid protein, partial [Brevibacterium sp.]|nr:phage major capsid protein [Brevibacterium sp.]
KRPATDRPRQRRSEAVNLKAQRAAALKAAQDIVTAAEKAGRDLTDDEAATVRQKLDEARELKAQIDRQEKSAGLLAELSAEAGGDDEDDEDDEDGDELDAAGRKRTARFEVKDRATFGERFIKSDPFRHWKDNNPGGVGRGTPINIGRVKIGTLDEYMGSKALTSPQAHRQPTRYPTVDMVDRDRLTFLDLISKGRSDGEFDYVQVTGVTRNAAIVPEATSGTDDRALKPTSDLQTRLAQAREFTYADGYDVTNKLLRNAPAFASYMDQELGYSLDYVIEDKILNGTGEDGEPEGLLHTTGVQQVSYAAGAETMDQIKAVRRAISRVTRLPGGTVQAVVLNPEDDENIDLLQDGEGRFYGQGPFGSGPGTLWGRPRVTSERVAPGEFLLGDFRQIALLDTEGLSVLAFNQHKDYAQRNMVYVRAELSAIQVIWRPNRLVRVAAAPAEG